MNDPQVIAASKIKPRDSLLDKLIEQYDITKEPAYPFQIRVILCGKVLNSFKLPQIEDVCKASSTKADCTNPFSIGAEKSRQCSTFLIDYGGSFFQVIEGDERQVFFYMSELCSLQQKNHFSDIRVLFIDDDIDAQSFGFVVLDVLPAEATGGNDILDLSADDLADYVAGDITSLMEMSKIAGSSNVSYFSQNLKFDHPNLFPKSERLEYYMKCSLFLTAEEFKLHFCNFPDVVREVEINHPSEDPLKY